MDEKLLEAIEFFVRYQKYADEEGLLAEFLWTFFTEVGVLSPTSIEGAAIVGLREWDI
jgi:hypothetical protein